MCIKTDQIWAYRQTNNIRILTTQVFDADTKSSTLLLRPEDAFKFMAVGQSGFHSTQYFQVPLYMDCC